MDNGYDKYTDDAFRDAFSDWEADFSPGEMQADWSQLSQHIGSVSAGSGTAAGKAASLFGAKAMGIAGAAAVLTTSAVLIYNIYVSPAGQPEASVQTQAPAAGVPQTVDRPLPAGQAQALKATEPGPSALVPAAGNHHTATAPASAGKAAASRTVRSIPSPASGRSDVAAARTDAAEKGNQAMPGLNPGGNQKANTPGGAPVVTEVKARAVRSLALSDSVLCTGEAVRVSGISPAIAENARISWGDAATASYKENLTHVYNRPGQYQIQLLSPAGAIQRTVQVMPAPQADFEARDAENKRVRFRSAAQYAGKAVWDFGDGSSLQEGDQPEHQYRDTGFYNVRLIASNSRGCTDTVQRSIYVGDLRLYNVLTPDGDGTNDDWIIPVRNADYYELVVIDKTGRKVFETRDASIRWNARVFNTGERCEAGAYNYLLRYRYAGQSEVQQLQGTVRVQL